MTSTQTGPLAALERAIDERIAVLSSSAPPTEPTVVQTELVHLMSSYDHLVSALDSYLVGVGSGLSAMMRRVLDPRRRDSLREYLTINATAVVGRPVAVRWAEGRCGSQFLIMVGNRPVAALIPEANLTDAERIALRAYADLSSVILGSIAVENRYKRQTRLLAHPILPTWNTETPPRHHAEYLEKNTSLTAREREVLMLVLTGAANREIAAQLFVSVETVRSHMRQLLRKFGARNRAELIGRMR